MKITLFSAILFITLTACNHQVDHTERKANQTPAKLQEIIEPFSFSLDSLIQKGGGPCVQEDVECMKIRAVWPIINGGSAKIRKIMNDTVRSHILRYFDNTIDQNTIQIQAAVDSLFSDYAYHLKEDPEYSFGWYMEAEGNMTQHDSIGIFDMFFQEYMGGAHPNSSLSYLNFNLNSGALIGYNDFVKNPSLFQSILEQEFKKQVLSDDLSMDEFFWDSGFELPNNFRLEKKGIDLLYNPYEIAPYAYGMIEFSVDYETLKDAIKL